MSDGLRLITRNNTYVVQVIENGKISEVEFELEGHAEACASGQAFRLGVEIAESHQSDKARNEVND